MVWNIPENRRTGHEESFLEQVPDGGVLYRAELGRRGRGEVVGWDGE